VLSNADLERMVETTDEWIVERTGIKERRVLHRDLCTSDLAAEAARAALAAAGVSVKDVDCIIVGTVTPDMAMPACAVFVQHKLGAATCAAFDISAACAGFVYGLGIADGLIRNRQFRRVLVIGVEILTRITDYKDRNTCVLFGDGAGAVVLGPEEQPEGTTGRGILSTHLYADGAGAEHLVVAGGGTRYGTSALTLEQNRHTIKMEGKQVFTAAVRNISAACQIAIEHNHMSSGDVDLVIAHQANLRIVEAVAQRCGMPLAKYYLNIHKYGNTSSASIPIALDEAVREGRVKPGMMLLMCALGAGLSWGSAMVRW
jgi:3-oxoacyl-[acyl-carrier-protein] synthase-3